MWSLMWSGRSSRNFFSSMPLVFCHFSSSWLLIMFFRFSGRLLLDIQISVSLFFSSFSSILVVFDCRYFCVITKRISSMISKSALWDQNQKSSENSTWMFPMRTANKSKPETQMMRAKTISPTELLVRRFWPKALR